MPQIGWFEILIIVSIAIVVIGPKDFPVVLKKIGSWIGSAKRYVSNIQNEVSSLENEDFVTQLREILDASTGNQVLEDEANEADFQQQLLNKVPLKIYIG